MCVYYIVYTLHIDMHYIFIYIMHYIFIYMSIQYIHTLYVGPDSRPDDDLLFAQTIVSKVKDIRDSVFFFGMYLYMYVSICLLYLHLRIHHAYLYICMMRIYMLMCKRMMLVYPSNLYCKCD